MLVSILNVVVQNKKSVVLKLNISLHQNKEFTCICFESKVNKEILTLLVDIHSQLPCCTALVNGYLLQFPSTWY